MRYGCRAAGDDNVEIGLFTDGLLHLPFAEAVETARRLGVQAVEIGTGNFSPATHCDLDRLLTDAGSRSEFLDIIQRHGLRLAALNCSGNPLHPNPTIAEKAVEITRKTLRLAGLLRR